VRLEITRKGMIEVHDAAGRLVSSNTVIEEAIEDLIADAEAHPEIDLYRITYPEREVRVVPRVVVVRTLAAPQNLAVTANVVGAYEEPAGALTWAAVSGATSYNVYRSAVSASAGFSLVAPVGPSPGYTDAGVTHDATYWWYVKAVAGGVEGPASSVVTARMVPGFSDNAIFPMSIAPGQTVSFESRILDADDRYALEWVPATAIPNGITVLSTRPRGLSASVGATLGQTPGHQVRLVPSRDADWTTRSTASGVFYSTNFTYKNAAKTQLITNVADLISSAFQTGNSAKLAWDTSLKLSGNGCLRLNMAGGAIDGAGTGWTFSFDGIGLNTKNTSKSQFYLQFAYYADSVQNNFNYGGSSSYGGKIIIVEAPDTSFDSGEVVFRRWVEPGGFVGAYSLPVNQMYYNQVTSQSRGLLNNLYDANHYGGSFPSPSTAAQWKQRHGYMSIGTVSDPDYANAPRIISNTWMTVEIYVDLVNDCVKIWMAPYGQAPKLIIGRNAGNGDLPAVGTIDGSNSNPKPIYTGAQLTNYANSPTAWPSTDTFVCYDEVIASNNPINFPGGYSLPFPGTDPVTGWPWTGTVFRG